MKVFGRRGGTILTLSVVEQDTTARHRLESAATTVKPPGRSANPFDPAALNYQNRVEDFLEKLIAEGLVDTGARTVLQGAPRKLGRS